MTSSGDVTSRGSREAADNRTHGGERLRHTIPSYSRRTGNSPPTRSQRVSSCGALHLVMLSPLPTLRASLCLRLYPAGEHRSAGSELADGRPGSPLGGAVRCVRAEFVRCCICRACSAGHLSRGPSDLLVAEENTGLLGLGGPVPPGPPRGNGTLIRRQLPVRR